MVYATRTRKKLKRPMPEQSHHLISQYFNLGGSETGLRFKLRFKPPSGYKCLQQAEPFRIAPHNIYVANAYNRPEMNK